MLSVGVPMAKATVTKLSKSWRAVSKAQVMGWREGGSSGTFTCTGMMSPHGEDKENREKEMEVSNGDMSPVGDFGDKDADEASTTAFLQTFQKHAKKGVLTFFLFLKGLTSSQGLLVTYHKWGRGS